MTILFSKEVYIKRQSRKGYPVDFGTKQYLQSGSYVYVIMFTPYKFTWGVSLNDRHEYWVFISFFIGSIPTKVLLIYLGVDPMTGLRLCIEFSQYWHNALLGKTSTLDEEELPTEVFVLLIIVSRHLKKSTKQPVPLVPSPRPVSRCTQINSLIPRHGVKFDAELTNDRDTRVN